jgi:DnaJ-class molecular chaperone
MKCIPFFIALIFLCSCESRIKNLKNEEVMGYIFSLESSIDSLNQNVDSLNYRLLQLEESAANQDLVTEMKADGPKISSKITCPNCKGKGSEIAECGNCSGSGYYLRGTSKCVSCNGTGYGNYRCSVCHGNRRINEYE